MGKHGNRPRPGSDKKGARTEKTMMSYYDSYFDRLSELSMVMFEYKGMPDTVDVRYLERALFYNGQAVFFHDDALGHLALKCAFDGGFNVYGIPGRRRAYADNGYSQNLDAKNSIVIWNNYNHTNSFRDVSIFARRLANIDATIDVNMNAQKTPVLIRCSEQQRITMMNFYNQYEGNHPFIFGDDKLDTSQMTVFTTGAPFIVDKAREEKNQVWNEFMTYCGISNTNITKRERMITDEVIRSQGGTIASRYSRLEMRRQACEEINKMFGLKVTCDFREDFREANDQFMYEGDSGGGGSKQISSAEEV